MVSSQIETVLIILGIFLILGGIGAGTFFTTDTNQEVSATQCSGGQVLSIDDISVTFSNELQKDVIRVLFSTVPTSECLDIYVSTNQIENSIDGFDAYSPIRGDIILTKKDIEFDINADQNEKFFKIGIFNQGDKITCSAADCSGIVNSFASVFGDGWWLFTSECYCVSDDFRGVGGSFSSGSSLLWETDISIGGDMITLDNSDRSGEIGSIAIVKWAGNLAGNIGFSRPNRDVYKPFTDNNFRMIDSGTVGALENSYIPIKNSIIACDGYTAAPCDALDDARAYNAQFDSRTINGLSQWVSQESKVSSASISSNTLIINLNSPIVYPQFTLDIVAEEVGVFISTGKPSVTCPNNFDIISGETRDVSVILENIGDDSGSFSYGVSCSKGSSTVSPISPQNIYSGQSKTITARLGLTVEQGTETSTCTFTATELNTFEQDSCSFSFTSTKQTQCIQGTSSCENGNKELWTCLADGSFKKTECQFGCEAFEDTSRCRLQQNEICDDGIDNDGDGLIDYDDPECKQIPDVCGAWIKLPEFKILGEVYGGQTLLPDLFCIINKWLEGTIFWFSILVGLISGGIGISYLLKFIPKKSTKTKIIYSIITFLLLGIAFSLLALIYFWWIVLFVVIIGIIRAIIPGV